MSLKGAGYIVGAYEHPTRKAPDKSVALLHAECAKGALEDAGLTKDDVDGYFCAGDAPGLGPLSMVDYMNLKCRHVDSTDIGGSSYQVRGRPRAGGDRRRALQRRADHARRPAAQRGHGDRHRAARRQPGAARRCSSSSPTARRPRTCTRCAPRATCTSTAPPASSSPGSRSPPRTTRSTTRTRCCATW